MSTLQVIGLIAVMVGGAAVVLTPDPLRQTIMLGIFGAALTFLFFVFQAPDVALSEIVVSSIGLPLIVLAALRKIGRHAEQRAQAEREQEEDG